VPFTKWAQIGPNWDYGGAISDRSPQRQSTPRNAPAAEPAIEWLLEPGRLGTLEVPNRIVRTAHGTRLYGADRLINDDLIAYHANAVRGGCGLTILEIGTVHRSSTGGLGVWSDQIISGYERLMAALRPLGGRVFQQLYHGGAQALPAQAGRPPWSASPVQPNPAGTMPIAMDHAQIDEIVAAFADAAGRVVAGGLDGIELHFAHGYLVHQFISPLTNLRADEYGGDLRGRMRFPIEIVEAVRNRVGRDFPLGVRISTETVPGGTSVEEAIEIVAMLERTGQIDFVDISIGSYFRQEKFIGGMYEPPGYMLPTSLPVAHSTRLPTIVTGRITTLIEAERLVAGGHSDFVGLTRAHIADPEIVRKTLSGRAAEVRPCIACDMCVASMYAGGIGCAVNAGAGAERTRGDHHVSPAPRPRHVLVVGAGPAGLEAARVAAARGHQVTLLERSDRLGGQLRIAASAPSRGRLSALLDWFERELGRLEVDLQLGVEGDAELVREIGADTNVLAVGVQPRLDGVHLVSPGEPMELDRGAVLTSSWEVLSGALGAARRVTVIDDSGHYEAVAAAERLLADGAEVNYVTTLDSLLAKLHTAFEPGPAVHRLRTSGRFSLSVRTMGLGFDGSSVDLRDIDGGESWSHPADAVVFVSANPPDPALAAALSLGPAPLHVIGDALSQRHLRAAIGDGNRVGSSV
jgi:2,4-dienoyl-CoA reductase-like NADH-dependent reductase (Old Yellow Enzyme family)